MRTAKLMSELVAAKTEAAMKEILDDRAAWMSASNGRRPGSQSIARESAPVNAGAPSNSATGTKHWMESVKPGNVLAMIS